MAVFLSMRILSFILWTISPSEDTFSMKVSIFPLPLVYWVIVISCNSYAMRYKSVAIDIAFILSSFFISNSRFVFGIVVKTDSVWLVVIIWIVNNQSTCGRLTILVESSFEREAVLCWVNFSLTFNSTMSEISLINVPVSLRFKDSMTMGKRVKVSKEGILIRRIDDTFSLLITSLIPISKIVEIFDLVFVGSSPLCKVGKI